jgi:probable HAF family extracellular repeat protein
MSLFATLLVPIHLPAQEQQQSKPQPRYKLIDLGTFGGPSSYLQTDNGTNGAPNRVINSEGTVAGWGDTSTPDPYAPNCFNPYAQDCFLPDAFQWRNGVLAGLGVLRGGDASTAAWISDTGLIAGQSRNGVADPLIPDFGETRAVLWQDGHITDLGTLGGNESSAFSVNNRGQVVGVAVNTIPDPFSFLATQLRAFLWQNGSMQDLGTLGGPEGWALFINERGQVAGFSTTNFTPNPTTGFPTTDPFLWEPPSPASPSGRLIDLGTLGGTNGSPDALNNRGQVVGSSNLAGDVYAHPFLWEGGALTDLGTLGGSYGSASSLNDAGEIVGWAYYPGDLIFQAVLWKHGGMTALGAVPGDCCSLATWINSKAQVVGTSGNSDFSVQHAFLWEKGGPAIDLNTLIAPGSGLTLTSAGDINDRGEIAGAGVLSNGDTHAFLLIPCGHGEEDCRDSSAVTQSGPALGAQPRTIAAPANPGLGGRSMLDRLRARGFLGRRGLGPASGPTR